MNKLARRFKSSTSGNFASMLAITLAPLLVGVGMMIDYTNLTREQEKLQSSVDAAILMAGAYYRDNGRLPPKADVLKLLRANNVPDASINSLQVVDGEVQLVATIKTDPLFLDILGNGGFDQTADATVPIGTDNAVEIAMVLDVTDSMQFDGKMTSLKKVATNFSSSALSYAPRHNPDAVRLAVIPFEKYVNVGTWNRYESWLDVPADSSTRSCETKKDLISKSGCRTDTINHPAVWVEEQCYGPTFVDGVMTAPARCDPAYLKPAWTENREICTNYEYGPEYEVCSTTTATWNGCVGSRRQPLNFKDHRFNKRVPGLVGISCGKPILPLTNSKSDLTNHINSLTTSGSTYMAPGVSWGQRVLSNQAPYSEARKYERGALKYLIVMSDGDNTIAQNVGSDTRFHDNTDAGYSNQQTLKACGDARKRDIVIFSIAFGTTISSDGKRTLQGCAGDPENYYDASDAKALEEAFDDILQNIFTIRLSS